MTSLNDSMLDRVDSRAVPPRYERRAVTPGIVHVGVGGFHRAHEAVYTDDLLAQGGAAGWGICGVGLRIEDRLMRDALVPQDCLYTVVTRSEDGDKARIVGSLVRYLFAPEEPQAVRDVLASPRTRIVSLTVTEGVYRAEAAQQPGSVFAFLAEALARRRAEQTSAFTVLSCDNLPHNGDAAKRALLASIPDPDLAAWIKAHVSFPNSMVDRITPQTTDADWVMVRDEFGIEDAWPVVCEPYKQWVIEDNFVSGRPAWEQAGAQFVPDVAPYETMKLRLLNGGHSAIGYLGFLCGFQYIPEVVADSEFREFLMRLWNDEVTPLLPPVPGIDLAGYKATLLTRFGNPVIKDQVSRICLDGSSKMPNCLLPSITEALNTGRPIPLLTLALAGWFRYLRGIDESGNSYQIEDPRAESLQALAREGGDDPRPLLGQTDLFDSLGQNEAFVQSLASALALLSAEGARAALKRTLGLAKGLS